MSLAHLHATSYARVLRAMPGVELRVADPDYRSRAPGEPGGPELAAELGVGYLDSYAELLAWQPEGVVICSENSRHRGLAELASAAGAHVLCEKPLATTRTDARAMIDACAAAGVWLMMAYPVRFSPVFAACRATHSAGGLGRLLAATGTNNGRLPIGDRAWFVDERLSGGGSMMDHVVHVADLLDALLSGDRATSVYASTNRLLHGDQSTVETGGLVSVQYGSGPIATIDCSWSRPAASATWGGLTLTLVGTEAVADLDAFGSRVDGQSRADGALWLPYGPNTDELLLNEFLDAIGTGRVPQPDGEVGYRTLEIALAGYESVRTGQPVDLAIWV